MKKLCFVKIIYRKIEKVFENSAKKSIQNVRDESVREYVNKLYVTYRDKNAWIGVIGPLIVSVIPTCWQRPNPNEMFPFGIQCLVIYRVTIIGALAVVVLGFSYSFLQKNVWSKVLEDLKNDEVLAKEEELAKLLVEKEMLCSKNSILERDNVRLEEFRSVVALFESKRKKGEEQSLPTLLVQRILASLGPGEFSVALYYAYNDYVRLDEYEFTRSKQDIPSCKNRRLHKKDPKYGTFHFTKFIFSNETGKRCYKNKEEMRGNLTGNIDDINQYASYHEMLGKNCSVLLEIISYNNTKFSYDLSREDGMNVFFDELFSIYLPLLEMFIGREDVKTKICA